MRAMHNKKSAATAHGAERRDLPTARFNVPQDQTRGHIFFNKMLRLSIVKEQRLPRLITLVIMPQKHTPIEAFTSGYRTGQSTFDLGA